MYHPRVFIMDIFSWNRSSSIYEHQNLQDFNPITLQIQKERESLQELKVIMWLFLRFYCSCDMLPFQWQLSVWGKKFLVSVWWWFLEFPAFSSLAVLWVTFERCLCECRTRSEMCKMFTSRKNERRVRLTSPDYRFRRRNWCGSEWHVTFWYFLPFDLPNNSVIQFCFVSLFYHNLPGFPYLITKGNKALSINHHYRSSSNCHTKVSSIANT